MYKAEEIENVLSKYKESLLACETQTQTKKILKKTCKELGVIFVQEHTSKVEAGYVISGMYDMTKDQTFIILGLPKEKSESFLIDEDWSEFKFLLSQTIQHEFIHRHQYSWRDWSNEELDTDFRISNDDIEADREYLSEKDEIAAYSHDIAMEILYYYKEDPLKILRNIDRRKKIWSYNYYKKTFRGTDWFEVKKALLKNVFRWLPQTKVYR